MWVVQVNYGSGWETIPILRTTRERCRKYIRGCRRNAREWILRTPKSRIRRVVLVSADMRSGDTR